MTVRGGGGHLVGGVHRVPGPAAPLVTRLAAEGWVVALVPSARTDDELWDGLVGALGLPGWFGRNLDALDESLGDLEVPTALVLTSWWAFATVRPERWADLLQLLRERTDDRPPLLVVLAD